VIENCKYYKSFREDYVEDPKMSSSVYDVVIVGGGCAGAKAAESLYTNGVRNILLLEAQARLGGRIQTLFVDDVRYPVEMGANWLHGIEVQSFVYPQDLVDLMIFVFGKGQSILQTYRGPSGCVLSPETKALSSDCNSLLGPRWK
jgi:hypothetical protein